jgi:hypothetical protein
MISTAWSAPKGQNKHAKLTCLTVKHLPTAWSQAGNYLAEPFSILVPISHVGVDRIERLLSKPRPSISFKAWIPTV